MTTSKGGSSVGGGQAGPSRQQQHQQQGYHHRSFASPTRPDRRVIFPSLHRARSPPKSHPPTPAAARGHRHHLPDGNDVHNGDEKSRTPDASPTDVVSANIASHLPLMRANSLDGIPIPLPKLSVEEGDGHRANEEFALRPANRRIDARLSSPSPLGKKWASPPSRSSTTAGPSSSPLDAKSPSSSNRPLSSSSSHGGIFGDALRRRTYFIAASPPTPVAERSPSRRSDPPPSILRRRSASSSTKVPPPPIAVRGVPETSGGLSPDVPTLASTKTIRSLHSRDNSAGGAQQAGATAADGEGGIGESVQDLERISDTPKVLPRKQCAIGRVQSDTVVANKNDEAQGSRDRPRRDSASDAPPSRDGSVAPVSRHASLECLSGNKRTTFDPHVTVYEFPVSGYERRGGSKWFSERELADFKREAIQRIRLRSTMRIVPTGTGRSMVVATKEGGTRGRDGSMSSSSSDPVNNYFKRTMVGGNGGTAKGGSVMFNHPALGCEDELDNSHHNRHHSEAASVRAREDAIRDRLSREIRNVLVVDPHEIFLALFTKSLKHMIPHASVATARSAEEAMTRVEAAKNAFPLRDGGSTHGFDIVIIEERLRAPPVQQLASGGAHAASPTTSRGASTTTQTAGDDSVQRRWCTTSGSTLIRHLVESERESSSESGGSNDDGVAAADAAACRSSLFVGVSARLAEDRARLEKAGADCVWSKPPPEMNSRLRNDLLQLLMKKRCRADLKLFD